MLRRQSLRLTDTGLTVLRDSHFDDLGLLGAPALGYLLDKKYADKVRGPVIATPQAAGYVDAKYGLATCDDPESAFWDLHQWLGESGFFGWFNPVDDHGADVHPSACIGKDGFEHHNGIPIKHYGGVSLGRGATVGAHSAIDRSLWSQPTTIGNDSHIDNLVHVAHNVQIGKRCRIVAGTVIGGSAVIGDDVFIGIGALIRPGIRIGDGAFIGMGVIVLQDVAPGERLTVGNSPHRGSGMVSRPSGQGALATG